jgi:hypothetical protein
MARQAELLKVVLALGAGGGGADCQHRREQQADQDGDDRYHHQQLEQREPATPSGTAARRGPPRPGGSTLLSARLPPPHHLLPPGRLPCSLRRTSYPYEMGKSGAGGRTGLHNRLFSRPFLTPMQGVGTFTAPRMGEIAHP